MKVQKQASGIETRRKKQKKIKFFLVSILVLAAIVTLMLSPVFNITGVAATGSRHYTQEQLVGVTGLSAGLNGFKTLAVNVGSVGNVDRLFSLRFATAEESILNSFPYVKEAVVRYKPVGTVRIDIIERQPIALVPYMGTNLLVDDEGYVLDTVQQPEDKVLSNQKGPLPSDEESPGPSGYVPLPYIKGLMFESYKMGQALICENQDSFMNVKLILESIRDSDESNNTKIMELVNYLDVSTEKSVCLSVDSRIVVNLGDVKSMGYDTLLYRINFFRQIFMKNLKKEDRGLLDFTIGDNPKFIPEK